MSDVWGEGDNGRRKKKRSRTAQKLRARKGKNGKRDNGLDQGFDLPPVDEDDFDMDDLVGSLKKKEMVDPLQDDSKPSVAFKRVIADPPTAGSNANVLIEETKEAKILKFGAEHCIKRKEKSFVQPRMEGESKRAFQKRMIAESKQIISNDKIKAKTNEEKKRKKKEYLNSKKKKKKQSNSQELLQSGDNDRNEVEFNTTDQVLFGEQVERPPTFPQLPRGAKMNKTQIRQARSGMNLQQREIEKLAMERLREEVQAKYAQLKEQRRKIVTNR